MNGLVVAITGASSGIGLAIAKSLTEQGASVTLGARGAERLQKEAAILEASGAKGRVAWRVTDVKKRADVDALVHLTLEKFGRLDVMVNNAGIAPCSPFSALQVEDWDNMIDVNVKGMLYGIAAALPIFEKQKSGHLINILSTAGLQLGPGMGVYAATKNAMRTVTEALRQEKEAYMRLTEISPGMTKTDILASVSDAQIKSTYQKRIDDVGMEPDAIARAVVYAIQQPPEVNVGSIVIRPSAQG